METQRIITKELTKELKENNYLLERNNAKLGNVAVVIVAIYIAFLGDDKLSKIPLLLVLILLIIDNLEMLVHYIRNGFAEDEEPEAQEE